MVADSTSSHHDVSISATVEDTKLYDDIPADIVEAEEEGVSTTSVVETSAKDDQVSSSTCNNDIVRTNIVGYVYVFESGSAFSCNFVLSVHCA